MSRRLLALPRPLSAGHARALPRSGTTLEPVVRAAVAEVGYDDPREPFCSATLEVQSLITARRSPRRSPTRRKGYSSHGLRFDDVVRAFAEAEQRLGVNWQLKGRGHCRRVSLDARYSRYAMKGAAQSWAWVTPRYSGSVRRLMPFAIVLEAAKILGISAHVLISREF